jgi:hypothetical protein
MKYQSVAPATNEARQGSKAQDAARRAPAEDQTRLFLLSYLLTAELAKAERCFVPALEPAAEDNAAIRDWVHSWARRTVIRDALQIIAPHPERGSSDVDSGTLG